MINPARADKSSDSFCSEYSTTLQTILQCSYACSRYWLDEKRSVAANSSSCGNPPDDASIVRDSIPLIAVQISSFVRWGETGSRFVVHCCGRDPGTLYPVLLRPRSWKPCGRGTYSDKLELLHEPITTSKARRVDEQILSWIISMRATYQAEASARTGR